MELDYLIENGIVVDGTGAPPRSASVGVKDGMIALIENTAAGRFPARQVLDAKGRIVSPGFIDAHAHSEQTVLRHPDILHKISQGITAEITGHCGESGFPCRPEQSDGKAHFTDLDAYRRTASETGFAIDQVSMIGHGDLRVDVLGEGARPADASAIAEMCCLLREAFSQGAAGMSSGLEYAPGMYSDLEELVSLASVCASYDRVYSTHMRSEGSALLEAADEAIATAERSRAVTVISHIKACGKENHGKVSRVLAKLDDANRRGASLYADVYPYTAGCTGLTIVLPQWALENGRAEMLRILSSETGRSKVRSWFSLGTDVWENRSILTGWDRIMVAGGHRFTGKSISEIASQRGTDEIDTLMDLILEADGVLPGILHSACEADLLSACRHERVMICSDGVDTEGLPHPRLYGSHTRYLSRYADLSTDEGLVSSVRKMTGLPSLVYRLHGIGTLVPGSRANITVWDAASVRDHASYEEPTRLSDGIEAVFVGGTLSYYDKEVISRKNGRFYERRRTEARDAL